MLLKLALKTIPLNIIYHLNSNIEFYVVPHNVHKIRMIGKYLLVMILDILFKSIKHNCRDKYFYNFEATLNSRSEN